MLWIPISIIFELSLAEQQTISTRSERKMSTQITTNTIIVFSESLGERDFFRSRINDLGLNVVCFEKEAACFDNVKPISPRIVIVQTDSQQVAWRFIFALYALDVLCPLLFVSDFLEIDGFLTGGENFPIHLIEKRNQVDRLMTIISEILSGTNDHGGKQHVPLFLGQTDIIRQIRSMVPSLAESRDPLLITGEKGTGKELFVRLLAKSAPTENILVKIDCGELVPALLTNGWFEKIKNSAAGSKSITIFFDGIHLIPKQIQAEILLTVEQADNWKDQDNSSGPRDIRFMATSEAPVEELVRNGHFRKDLYYRLNVIPIFLPPLRDRKEDIALLMDYFIIEAAARSDKCIKIPSKKAKDTLYLYHWPGNVEELKTYMQRVSISGNESCILANSNMPKVRRNTREHFLNSASLEDLPKPHEIKSFLPDVSGLSLKHICEEFVSRTEKKLMQKALDSTNWNRKKAAKLLSISYKSMLNKMKAYDIF